ncbi:phage tail assembly protein [Rhizobium lentis]|uniref:phage tail assembly protein n=1 Tax=Rhizobium lentis TaxID=1138194 RepID=UPI001C83F392|nr:phage tail assembly protein [Rhizobium lentis]MBX5082165.1 phage tail assembly protein [Rhizobium lentis]MBX5094875.1 phage tail assembly protein [Rhizobium lentis]MBX5119600.1 phage tail assembly protein [Rhizobium lentis]
MADTIIKLSKSYTAHDKSFDAVTLREPTYSEIFRDGLGRPSDWQPSQHGPMLVKYPEVVDAYLQRICVSPGYECIGALSAIDSLKLEEAVTSFFLERKEPPKSPTD